MKRTVGRQRGRAAGFSLIELLVAMAITVVLIGLLFGPLVKGFQLTAAAQNTTEAQDAARVTMEQISREIGSAAAVRDTTQDYLNLRIYTLPNTQVPGEVLAHAFNSYMDIVPAASSATGTNSVVDPTTGHTLTALPHKQSLATTTTAGAASTSPSITLLTTTGTELPLAPGKTIIRYFIGLRHPINYSYTPGSYTFSNGSWSYTPTGSAAQEQPYTNRDENQTIAPSDATYGNTDTVQSDINNPYILYRAEVPVSRLVKDTGTSKTVSAIDPRYFATDANGNVILDDPDFFRTITIPIGGNTADMQHDDRVYYWFQAARPVIGLTDLNLIFQPHDGSNNVVYANDAVGLPSGIQLDTSGIPLVRTSVSFVPATVANDPLAATSTNDVSQGYGAAPQDVPNGPYIPSKFKAQQGQWAGVPDAVISEPTLAAVISGTAKTTTPSTYTTYVYVGADVAAKNTGDLIEANGSTDVYNITQNRVISTGGVTPQGYVPVMVDGGSGTIDFALPDLPVQTSGGVNSQIAPVAYQSSTTPTFTNTTGSADTGNPQNAFWFYTFGMNDTDSMLEVHLQPQPGTSSGTDQYLLPNSAGGTTTGYTPNITTTKNLMGASTYVHNGHIVVNSERVFGPEQDPGPGSADPDPNNAPNAPLSTYSGSTPPLTDDLATLNAHTSYTPAKYSLVPYRRVPLNLAAPIGSDEFMMDYAKGVIYFGSNSTNINTTDVWPQRRTVLISYDYQANDVQLDDTTNNYVVQAAPDAVRASYQTGTQQQVSIGVRLYDPSTGAPTYFSTSNAVTVGNATR